jgi:hypothetical protein
LQSFFGFGASCETEIELDAGDGGKQRKQLSLTKDGVKSSVPLYVGSEDVTGVAHVRALKGKKIDLEHNGIKIEV